MSESEELKVKSEPHRNVGLFNVVMKKNILLFLLFGLITPAIGQKSEVDAKIILEWSDEIENVKLLIRRNPDTYKLDLNYVDRSIKIDRGNGIEKFDEMDVKYLEIND